MPLDLLSQPPTRADAIAYSSAYDQAVAAALDAEPLSAIMGRVLVAILGTIPPAACEPSQIRAIRMGVADAVAGKPCRTPRAMTAVPGSGD